MKKIILIVLVTFTGFASGYAQAFQVSFESGYARVNGLQMYYEIHGEGQPIVLLHGAYMTIDLNWSEVIPELSKFRKVIAVELQGHGRTADIGRQFSYETMADDIAQLLRHLKIQQADVMGYSMGGTVALQLGIKNPELVNKMVIISTTYRSSGWLRQAREVFTSVSPDFLDSTPLKTMYDTLAPDPGYWSAFVKKMIDFDKQEYDLGAENMKKLKSPILFIMGDNDGVDLGHIAEMYKLVGGDVFGDMQPMPQSQLAILPGKAHVSLMMDTRNILNFVQPFLNAAQQPTVQHK